MYWRRPPNVWVRQPPPYYFLACSLSLGVALTGEGGAPRRRGSAHHGDRGHRGDVVVLLVIARGVGAALHLDGAVDAGALEDDDRLGLNVPVHGSGSLHLDALAGVDRSDDAAAEDDVAGVDVAGDLALAAEQHLAGVADVALDGALDLDDP